MVPGKMLSPAPQLSNHTPSRSTPAISSAIVGRGGALKLALADLSRIPREKRKVAMNTLISRALDLYLVFRFADF